MFLFFGKKSGGIQQRYVITIFGSTVTALGCILRYCIGIVITEMVKYHKNVNESSVGLSDSCPIPIDEDFNITFIKSEHNGEFNWSEETQGVIISSLFWTYSTLQVPMGLVASKFQPKFVIGFGILLSGLCTILLPFAARIWGAAGVVMMRVFCGIGQSTLYPSLSVLLSSWIPPQERARLGSIIMVGENVGTVISMALSGVVLSSGNNSWPYVFYLYGSLTIIWFIIWLIFGYNSPDTNPFTSDAEKKYLKESITALSENKNKPSTPWKEIATSLPVWANLIAQIGHEWGLITIINYLPKYMKSVLFYDIQKNGLLSAMPFFMMTVVGISAGRLTDYMTDNNVLPVTSLRKLFTAIANVGPALGILGASYGGCNRMFVVSMFTIGMGTMGFFYPSLAVNPLDLSPNYAGELMGIIGYGTAVGVISPYLVGVLAPDHTLQQWRNVFKITVTVMIISSIFYIFAGSGKVQSWNKPVVHQKQEKKPIDDLEQDIRNIENKFDIISAV
ncbi:putative inorganic phosphate cotransporter [Lycorma delicatula]|uniref:putative inorganic phosphate cotransporter n=1 Tax=Lycorma delicatula TaxID=130591 RepID=UPI003F519973